MAVMPTSLWKEQDEDVVSAEKFKGIRKNAGPKRRPSAVYSLTSSLPIHKLAM
jgi:hypothetical protein